MDQEHDEDDDHDDGGGRDRRRRRYWSAPFASSDDREPPMTRPLSTTIDPSYPLIFLPTEFWSFEGVGTKCPTPPFSPLRKIVSCAVHIPTYISTWPACHFAYRTSSLRAIRNVHPTKLFFSNRVLLVYRADNVANCRARCPVAHHANDHGNESLTYMRERAMSYCFKRSVHSSHYAVKIAKQPSH